MHAHWESLDDAADSKAPARYGHSLTSLHVENNVYLVCFGGTAADGITGQVVLTCHVISECSTGLTGVMSSPAGDQTVLSELSATFYLYPPG